MLEKSKRLQNLSKEAAQIRGDHAGRRMHWPEEFKKQVMVCVGSGLPIRDIAKATGITSWTIYDWRKRHPASSFSEMKVVPTPIQAPVSLRTARGTSIEMKFSDFRLLVQEGLLTCL